MKKLLIFLVLLFWSLTSHAARDTDPITYTSSIEDSTNLSAEISRDTTASDCAVLVVMHGFAQQVSDFDNTSKDRFIAYSGTSNSCVFAIYVELRGRGSSQGTADYGGREIQDIKDAIDYVLTNYASETDANNINIVGYSGGGGNALSVAARFPDTFRTVTSFFGMADYGFDQTEGWYHDGASSSHKSSMDSGIGDPTADYDPYHARSSLLAITNYTSGRLFLFHDEDDSSVPVHHTNNVATEFDNASLTNYTKSVTTSADSPRWTHGLPNSGAAVINAEDTFMQPIVDGTYADWTVPTSGTLNVPGFIDTKRFKLWLDTGLKEFGTVIYDMTSRTFTVTCATNSCDFTLTLKGQATNTPITSTINKLPMTATSDGSGNVSYSSAYPRVDIKGAWNLKGAFTLQ